MEEVLITSDVGVETTVKIIRRIEERVARDKYMNTSELQSILRDLPPQARGFEHVGLVHDRQAPPAAHGEPECDVQHAFDLRARVSCFPQEKKKRLS